MKLRKALVVYKKSTYQIQAVEHRESRFISLLEQGHSSVTRVKVAHQEHYGVLERVKDELSRRGVEVIALARADLTGPIDGVDLAVSVGGDGTFLDTSHFVQSVALLGVNSSRSSSFGHFCLANEENLGQVLDGIMAGEILPLKLLRLRLVLNGSPLPEPVLNEVLICHKSPAGTSRYFIELDGAREEQRSGGIWIGPPGGSTGSLRAAGGVIQPIADRHYQYLVREPGPRPYEKWRLLKGVHAAAVEIKLVSQMRTGAIYIDGQHISYDFPLGDELVVSSGDNDLDAFVDPGVNDIFKPR